MVLYYCATKPTNVKQSYSLSELISFVNTTRKDRAVVKGSYRLNGWLKTRKVMSDSTIEDITIEDSVFLDPYCGVHSVFEQVTTNINGSFVEGLQNYPRYVGPQTQAVRTMEGLYTASDCATELKGPQNNYLLIGEDATKGVSFSMKPLCALNKTDNHIPYDKVRNWELSFKTIGGVGGFYTTITPNTAVTPYMTAIVYYISNIELSWTETDVFDKVDRLIFNKINYLTQTLTSLTNSINVTCSNPYDGLSMNFIKTANQNILTKNPNLCEYVSDVIRVDFYVNGSENPINFPLECYQDYALNYWKSLDGGIKNCVLSRYGSETVGFGIGCNFLTSINDTLQVQLQIDQDTNDNPSSAPWAVSVFINSYLTI